MYTTRLPPSTHKMLTHLLSITVILSFVSATTDDKIQTNIRRLPLWKSARPNSTSPLGGYPVIPTKPELISSASTANGTYNHNVFLHYVPTTDQMMAYWKNGVVDEDMPGQTIKLSWRNPNQKWSKPIIAFDLGMFGAMFGAPGITLPNSHVYIGASPGYYNHSLLHKHVAQGSQCALWPDSIDERNCGPAQSYAVLYHSTLLLRRVYDNRTLGPMFWAIQPPSLFSAATIKYNILSIDDMNEETQQDIAELVAYRNDPDVPTNVPCGREFTGTTKCEWCAGGCQKFTAIDYSLGITNERSTYSTSDGTDVILYRSSSGEPIFASSRIKEGGTWSPPTATNLPNDASNLNSGSLSNGLRYLVHNPVTRNNTKDNRDPLTLTTSQDGGWTWNETGVVATCLNLPFGNCVPRFVHDVDQGPSYPQLMEIVKDGSQHLGVWVAFTNNKEDVWVVKIVGS